MEECVLEVYHDKPVLGFDLSHDLFKCQHIELEIFERTIQMVQIYYWTQKLFSITPLPPEEGEILAKTVHNRYETHDP